ncbi:CoA transferase [Thermocatellispora tengchongensis]
MALTGRPDGPPLLPPGHAATLARALGRHLRDLTAGAVHLDGAAVLAERAALTGRTRQGATSVGGACRLLPTADGWAALSCARPDDPALYGALIGTAIDEGDPWPPLARWLRHHTGAELAERAELLGLAAAPLPPPHDDPTQPEPEHLPERGPVDVTGMLVVDFSALWAGPLCAHILGLAGARVVKVETPSRLDGARAGNPEFYHLLHAGHRSVVLDPAEAAQREALAALAARADVVIEASRPRALAGFGLDAGAITAADATWVSITAHGRRSCRVGFGDDIAASAGLVAHDPATGRPVFTGDAIADPLTGLTAAVRALHAIATGGGRLVEVAMHDVVAATLTPTAHPAPAARPDRNGGWILDTGEGPVPVLPPRRRTPPAGAPAPAPGRHTGEVLRELGISPP